MTVDGSLLATIVAHKRAELADAAAPHIAKRVRPLHSLRGVLAQPGARFILEIKRRAPSMDASAPGHTLGRMLDAYAGVADALSVLTDARFFGGSLSDLATVAACVDVPVLRKDFIVDPRQVHDAYAHGADAVLLMLSVLDDAGYRECARVAAALGLDVVTEVHDEAELDRALSLDAAIVGINNRSFADLSVDVSVSRALAPRVPDGVLRIAESGFTGRATVCALAAMVDAFLVGGALMRAARPDLLARELAHGEVKICGLTRPEDARAAWDAGARWGGVVFAQGSPRAVTPEAATAIGAASPLPLVGVFVGADPARVGELARAVPLAAVQLHGPDDDALIGPTRRALPRGSEIWRALCVDATLPATPAGVDRVLYDGARPGSGRAFDWSMLPRGTAFGLAGGIGAENVAAALATGASLIDVSTGVEASPGVKSTAKLATLFDAVRKATGGGR